MSLNRTQIEVIRGRVIAARESLPTFVQGDAGITDALGSARVKLSDVERLCDIRLRDGESKGWDVT